MDKPGADLCMKHLAFGAEQLSHEECIRRLKIWFVQGANPGVIKKWPADKQRTSHIFNTGGRRLQEFATGGELNPLSGFSDAELDDFCKEAY